jgi:Flp pilus assembly protein TadB
MQRLKAMAWLIVAGFFLLAPPGTLIVIAALVAGWVGGASSAIAVMIGIGVLGAAWIVVRLCRNRKRHRAAGK